MVFEMRNVGHLLWLSPVLLAMLGPEPALASCGRSTGLTAIIAEFDSIQTSRIDALLRFGEIHNLCFGIEFVDDKLLTEPNDFHIRNMSVHESIKVILGRELMLAVEPSSGVIEIRRLESPGEKRTIFDFVLPRFDARRASVQEISEALRMQLVVDLNPQVTGFAGSYPAGDLKDKVGPISEYNRTIRYLLDELVAQSKGGAWIARVRSKAAEDLTVAERRSVWTVVEYGVPKTGYALLLNAVANDLGSDAPLRTKDEKH